MIPVCDVQNREADNRFELTKVGVTGVKKPVSVKRNDKENGHSGTLSCTIDIFVDLPAVQKGSHLSRNLEVLREIVEESVKQPVSGVENLAADMCRKLLDRHEYASTANVRMVADYFKSSRTPNGRDTLETYTLMGESTYKRGQKIRKTLGVKVIGMTACPCAQETVTETLKCSRDWPVMSHNQRNVCTVILEMDEDINVEADLLIDLVEGAFSSPTYEHLKRDDEAAVVINAHKNPKFVEDVVRDVLRLLVEEFTDLPDNIGVTVRSESEESIHKHNAFAERKAVLGDLRA